MEKPDITPGPWSFELNPYSPNRVWAGSKLIAEVVGDFSDETDCNATAIAAVPDMIEALMNIENDNGSIPVSVWEMRNNALRKAGVELKEIKMEPDNCPPLPS